MRRRKYSWLALLLGLVLVAAACSSSNDNDSGGSGSGEQPEEGSVDVGGEPDPTGILRIGVNFANFLAQDRFDPGSSRSACEFVFFDYLYGTLVDFDENNEPVPALAESWQIESAEVVTFKLRPGLQFSDGTPLTAETVKASLEYVKEGFPARNTITSVGRIASIEAVDATTVRITTDGAFAASVVFMMGGREGMPLHPSMIDGSATTPIGAGPMKLESYTAGQEARMVRNDLYYEPWQLGGITYTNVEIGAPSLQALQSNSVDVVSLDGQTAGQVSGADYTVLRTPEHATLTYNNLSVRTDAPPFDNEQARIALNHAIDKEGILKAALGGVGTVAWQNFTEGTPWFQADLQDKYPYDPAKAKELMTAAGVAPGTQINVVYPGNPSNIEQLRQAEIVKANIDAIGLNAVLIPAVDTPEILAKFWNDKTANIFSASIPGSPDPVEAMNAKFGSSFQANQTGNSNPEVLALLTAANEAYADEALRADSVKQAVDVVVNGAYEVPIAWRPRNVAFNKTVLGGTVVAPVDVCDSIGLAKAYVIKK